MEAHQPMNVMEKHIEHMRQWLTGGRPLEFKNRRVKPRQGDLLVPLKNAEEASELLRHLQEEVPEAPWIIEIDGQSNDFVKALCQKIRAVRETSRFGLISPNCDDPGLEDLKEFDPRAYNSSNPNTLRFLNNLLIDLAIIPLEPESSWEERIRRWQDLAGYIILEERQG